jgi:hypothetical protein
VLRAPQGVPPYKEGEAQRIPAFWYYGIPVSVMSIVNVILIYISSAVGEKRENIIKGLMIDLVSSYGCK